MNIEKSKNILLDMRNGIKMCLASENPKNKEDIKEWENEIDAIETIINSYNKEKAKADKLELDYSRALTKIEKLQYKSKTTRTLEYADNPITP